MPCKIENYLDRCSPAALSGLQEVNFWEVSRIFRAGQIFWTRSAVKVGNRVGNQILGIKKGVELYGLTPCYYCGGDKMIVLRSRMKRGIHDLRFRRPEANTG